MGGRHQPRGDRRAGTLQRRAAASWCSGSIGRDEAPPGAPLASWRSRLLTQRQAEETPPRASRRSEDTGHHDDSAASPPGCRRRATCCRRHSSDRDGLPLHVEELIAAVTRSQARSTRTAVRATNVPDTIEDAVRARTRLDARPMPRRSPRPSAVIGRCFVPDVLAGVHGPSGRPTWRTPCRSWSTTVSCYQYSPWSTWAATTSATSCCARPSTAPSPSRDRRRYPRPGGRVRVEHGGRVRRPRVACTTSSPGLRELAYRRGAWRVATEAARLSAHREAFELLASGRPQHARTTSRSSSVRSCWPATRARPVPSRRTRSPRRWPGRPAPRIRQPADRISPPWPWSRSMPSGDGWAGRSASVAR